VHQGVEVEGGIEGIGQRVKKFDLVDGLDADIRRLRAGFLAARPVVTLEAVLGDRRGGGGGSASLFVNRGHGKSR
jgi:hypothetical protein